MLLRRITFLMMIHAMLAVFADHALFGLGSQSSVSQVQTTQETLPYFSSALKKFSSSFLRLLIAVWGDRTPTTTLRTEMPWGYWDVKILPCTSLKEEVMIIWLISIFVFDDVHVCRHSGFKLSLIRDLLQVMSENQQSLPASDNQQLTSDVVNPRLTTVLSAESTFTWCRCCCRCRCQQFYVVPSPSS